MANKAKEKKETLPNYRENLRKVINLPLIIETERKKLNLKMNLKPKKEETWKEPQEEENEEGRKNSVKEEKEGKLTSITLPQSRAVQRKETEEGASKLTRKVPEIKNFRRDI